MTDRIYMRIADLEELQYRVHCAIEMVSAIHTAITQGESTPGKNEYDALFGAYRTLDSLNTEFQNDVQQLWLAYRYERTVGHFCPTVHVISETMTDERERDIARKYPVKREEEAQHE